MTASRQCFWISPTTGNLDENGKVDPNGWTPSLVVENQPGHSPLRGGDDQVPYYWGATYAEARHVCEQANRDTFGLESSEVNDIVASSIAAGPVRA